MNGFLREYVRTFRYKSIDSFDFKKFFIDYFEKQGKGDALGEIDWDEWFYTPGMPKNKPT